jgi:CheY-like chemotaxis protein
VIKKRINIFVVPPPPLKPDLVSNATEFKILYAEDDIDDRIFLNESLVSNGLKADMVFVSNGEEAISYLESSRNSKALPALIILDLNMPKVDGRQTLSYLKKSPHFADIPVIILSTSESATEKDFCKERGVVSYCTKPRDIAGYDAIVKTMVPYVNRHN